MTGLHVFSMFVILGVVVHSNAGGELESSSKRVKRSATIYDVYTLDYFIELVEKIEEKSNGKSLKDIATYIRKLGYDSLLWNHLIGTSTNLPDGILSSDEKRVLKSMVAHSFDGSREMGVVLTEAGETIAIGHVINGICAGLSRNKQLSLEQWEASATDRVDNLYASTVSNDLGQTALHKKNDPSASYFGPGGTWKPNNECPERFERPNNGVFSEATDAEILGDVDGFLLGNKIAEWIKRGVRLGQLLRMYYSTGACYDSSYASCSRYKKFESLTNMEVLMEQVTSFANAFYAKYKSIYPRVQKGDITGIAKTTVEKFFPYLKQLHGGRNCTKKDTGCELPANLVFVMDESSSIKLHNYQIEKTFVKQIIDAFNISPLQTRVSVVEYSTNTRLSINIGQYNSKSRLKCAVNKLVYAGGWTHTAQAIELVHDKIFTPLQTQTGTSKVDISNIMILLTDGKSNDANKTALPLVVTSIKKDIKDLTILAVGVADYFKEELKLIATDKSKHVFTASDFDQLLKLVKSLQKRTCTTPVQIKFDFKEDKDDTVVTAFVSPNSVRYFELLSQTFYGVKDIYMQVTPVYGTVVIYVSRSHDTPGPSNYTYRMDPLSPGESMKFHIADPCAGKNETTCPHFYFAVYAGNVDCTCTERSCTLPSQIKFTIRKGQPSSSRTIHGSIFVLLITLTLTLFLQ